MNRISEVAPQRNGHDWESGTWGVIIGVSKCRRCGRVCRMEDFPRLDDAKCQGTKTKILGGKQKVRVARTWKKDGKYQQVSLNPLFKGER